jgi:hypothetical protein
MSLAGTWQGAIKLLRSVRQKYLVPQISEISEYDNFLDANSCRGGHIEISHMMQW